MREDRNPWLQPERMTRSQRLNTEDVQHRVAELARGQCCEQMFLYQVSTTPQVHEGCASRQPCEEIFVQDSGGRRGQGKKITTISALRNNSANPSVPL